MFMSLIAFKNIGLEVVNLFYNFIFTRIIFFLILANQSGSPEAFNMLGMLLERQRIYTAAEKAYQRYLYLTLSYLLNLTSEIT